MAMRKHACKMALLVFATLIVSSTTVCALDFEVESMTVLVYRDGLAHTTQTLTLDTFASEVQMPLLATSVDNLLVVDQNKKLVDYQVNGNMLTVYSLGAPKVTVEYDTDALTSKTAGVWTLNLNSPHDLTLILPADSTIVYLNQVPSAIDTSGEELKLSLFSGQWEISYITPLAPSSTQNLQPTATSSFVAPDFPVEYLIITVLIATVLAIVVALKFLFSKNSGVNTKKILTKHPRLMKEDIAVLEFLAQNGGKAFEAEIRTKFPDMPRTSLWRLVKRLEGLELVDVRKIGLENQVQLKN